MLKQNTDSTAFPRSHVALALTLAFSNSSFKINVKKGFIVYRPNSLWSQFLFFTILFLIA